MGKIKLFISKALRLCCDIKFSRDIDNTIKESLQNRLNTVNRESKKIKKEFDHAIKLARRKYVANIDSTIKLIAIENGFNSSLKTIKDICDYMNTYSYITIDEKITQLDTVELICFELDEMLEELQKEI